MVVTHTSLSESTNFGSQVVADLYLVRWRHPLAQINDDTTRRALMFWWPTISSDTFFASRSPMSPNIRVYHCMIFRLLLRFCSHIITSLFCRPHMFYMRVGNIDFHITALLKVLLYTHAIHTNILFAFSNLLLFNWKLNFILLL